jgi:hypothetical protein
MVPGAIQLPADALTAVAKVRHELGEQESSVLRGCINRWRSIQRLYHHCGWFTENYDAQEFQLRRAEWFRRLKELDRQGRLARRMSEIQREELRKARDAFWIESAGANAV